MSKIVRMQLYRQKQKNITLNILAVEKEKMRAKLFHLFKK